MFNFLSSVSSAAGLTFIECNQGGTITLNQQNTQKLAQAIRHGETTSVDALTGRVHFSIDQQSAHHGIGMLTWEFDNNRLYSHPFQDFDSQFMTVSEYLERSSLYRSPATFDIVGSMEENHVTIEMGLWNYRIRASIHELTLAIKENRLISENMGEIPIFKQEFLPVDISHADNHMLTFSYVKEGVTTPERAIMEHMIIKKILAYHGKKLD